MSGVLQARWVSTCLALALALAGGVAKAEIVVLDNGRFLRAEEYAVDGERATIVLEGGGEIVMPILRIDRVLEDEIVETAELEALPVSAPSLGLGFSEGHAVPDTPFGQVIFDNAKRENVNPQLVVAVVQAESAFDPSAVSSKGARGLMQLMPATAKRFGVFPQELFDPELNIRAGVTYLSQLIERYSDELPLVLAAYNAGEGAVAKHHGVPPYRETRQYIERIYSILGVPDDSSRSPGK